MSKSFASDGSLPSSTRRYTISSLVPGRVAGFEIARVIPATAPVSILEAVAR
jgi:hypothetical protein